MRAYGPRSVCATALERQRVGSTCADEKHGADDRKPTMLHDLLYRHPIGGGHVDLRHRSVEIRHRARSACERFDAAA